MTVFTSGPTMALKVLIADDHPLFIEGTRRTLEEADDIEVVGEARSGTQVLAMVRRTQPNVVLMDISMPGMDGLTCLSRVRKEYPAVKVIMFSASSGEDQIAAALRRGASAYVIKSVNPVDLPSAIRQACEQTVFHAVGDPGERDSSATDVDLTARELTILKAVARGMSNQAIAKGLWITEQTVKFHLTNIYRKLEVRNRTEATRYAHQHGLVDSSLEDSGEG
jgi:DNA-binding NarL/FixJ family response regulator